MAKGADVAEWGNLLGKRPIYNRRQVTNLPYKIAEDNKAAAAARALPKEVKAVLRNQP
jgi:hypothetical protein